jgi:peroxiredoxin
MRTDTLHTLPANLPVPVDDGACDHLVGMPMPVITLMSTTGREVCLADAAPHRTVVYCYPRTGEPDKDPPAGWNDIPGARGCTPEACAFRDHFRELQALNATVFGLSTQTTAYQQEVVERLHLPFELLSDADLTFATTLRLPTFVVDSVMLIKRLTLIVSNGMIEHVFYPIFPPDTHAEEVLAWLQYQP